MKIKLPDGFFMKAIVVFCIGYIVYLTEKSMALNSGTGNTVEGIYVAAIAFFGTELVLTMIKRIVNKGKDDNDG